MEVKVEVAGELKDPLIFSRMTLITNHKKTVLITRFTFHVSSENILQFHLSSRQSKEGE